MGKERFNSVLEELHYHDVDGKLAFEVCRLEPKGFRQRRPDPAKPGNWQWNLKGVELVPYRLPEVIKAGTAGETIFIAEGEKDVAALVVNGFTATCNAGGALKWKESFANYFKGAKVVCIIADKDIPGRKHAAAVAANVSGKAQSVKVIELPDIAGSPVKDAHDFFAAGGTAEQLRVIEETATEFESLAKAVEGTNPNDWFQKKFPTLTDAHGEPVLLKTVDGTIKVSDLNESFMAATLGKEANADEPAVYLRGENRFYAFSRHHGIYRLAGEEDVSARLIMMELTTIKPEALEPFSPLGNWLTRSEGNQNKDRTACC